MTREQVETEMAQYRTIFTVVRLLDAAQVGGEESVNSFCSCYSYWGKNTPCRNCISRQVLEDHRQRTKLEYMGSEVFQVTAVYREVDGVSAYCSPKIASSSGPGRVSVLSSAAGSGTL